MTFDAVAITTEKLPPREGRTSARSLYHRRIQPSAEQTWGRDWPERLPKELCSEAIVDIRRIAVIFLRERFRLYRS